MSHALNQIRQAGFSFELDITDNPNITDGFFVEPADKLTAPQLAYLKANRQQITFALKREHGIKNRSPYDDRRYCHECRHLRGDRCTVTRLQESLDDLPKRCNDFTELIISKH